MMKAYRFIAKISKEGTIQVPDNPAFRNTDVEVILFPKSESKSSEGQAAAFVERWAGFLSPLDTDKAKFDYLSDKHK